MNKGTRCGFCRKPKSSVGLIIAERLGEICCQCLSVCLEIIFVNQKKVEGFSLIEKSTETVERTGYKVKLKRYKDHDCFFCLRGTHEVMYMIKGEEQLICSHCAVLYSRLALSAFSQISKDISRKEHLDSSPSDSSPPKPS